MFVLSILLVERGLVSVGPERQARGPGDGLTHQVGHFLHAPAPDGLRDDDLVVDVGPDVIPGVVQGQHGFPQAVPGGSLYQVFRQLSAPGLHALPFLALLLVDEQHHAVWIALQQLLMLSHDVGKRSIP